jgi:hypothetical protein
VGYPNGIDGAEQLERFRQWIGERDIFLQTFTTAAWCIVPAGDAKELTSAIAKLEVKRGDGIYFGINPMNPGTNGVPSNEDIARRCRLFLDVDHPDHDLKVPASDTDKQFSRDAFERAVAYLGAKNWPAPVKIDSGNGHHGFWHIDLPNDDESAVLVASFLSALQMRFGPLIDSSVSDARRLGRVPGTWNKKGEQTAERPHRQCIIIDMPELATVVTAGMIQCIIGDIEGEHVAEPNCHFITDKAGGNSERPGGDFNTRASWGEILEPAGWKIERQRDKEIRWTRPGKDGGCSATTGYCKSDSSGDLLHIFSSNAPPFQAGESYSKFSAFTFLNHAGDFSAAARALAANGYGMPATTTTYEDIDRIELPLPAPWPILRPEAYHGLVGEIVHAIAPESEADPVGMLMQLLVASGSAIGRNAHARVEGDIHYCNLFLNTVGKSGHGRKGTAWSRVRQMMEMGDHQWLKDCIASGMNSGEGLIHRVRDSRAAENADGKLDIVDPGVRDKRLLAIETEFGQVLRNLKRESNTLSAILRMGWDNGNLSTLTKSPLSATNAHISIIAHITEPELHRYFDQVDLFNGFANRFLWVLVKRSKFLPEGGRRLDLQRLGLHLNETLTRARQLGELDRADETRELWAGAYPRLTECRPGLGGIVTSRAEAQVLRLAVLYAALDGIAIVMPEHLQAALAIWDYCEESARIIFGCEERLDTFTGSILSKLESAGESGLTRTGIRDALGRNAPGVKIVGALAKLRELGRARFEKQNTGGKKPAERWFAVTTLRH